MKAGNPSVIIIQLMFCKLKTKDFGDDVSLADMLPSNCRHLLQTRLPER